MDGSFLGVPNQVVNIYIEELEANYSSKFNRSIEIYGSHWWDDMDQLFFTWIEFSDKLLMFYYLFIF